MMATHAHQRHDCMIELPLTFTQSSPTFSYNRTVAFQRTKSTLQQLQKKRPEQFQSALDKFSKKNINLDHPRFIPVPPHERNYNQGPAYWTPLFYVWKKGKSRIVFDSAAKTNDVCINDLLLRSPDKNKSLRGVLTRFLRYPYAVTADMENMFHQFAIPDCQGTYLRFFWHKDNDPKKEIIENYSRVQLMGLCSSLAVANVGIRISSRKEPPQDSRQWIKEDDLLDPYQIKQIRTPGATEYNPFEELLRRRLPTLKTYP